MSTQTLLGATTQAIVQRFNDAIQNSGALESLIQGGIDSYLAGWRATRCDTKPSDKQIQDIKQRIENVIAQVLESFATELAKYPDVVIADLNFADDNDTVTINGNPIGRLSDWFIKAEQEHP